MARLAAYREGLVQPTIEGRSSKGGRPFLFANLDLVEGTRIGDWTGANI
jgi:hypothetical protein